MQMLITEDSVWEFHKKVNKYLEQGWKVVPDTLIVNVSITSGNGGYVTTKHICAVVLQDKPDEFVAG